MKSVKQYASLNERRSTKPNISTKDFVKDISNGAGWISDYMLRDKFEEFRLTNAEKRSIVVELARKGMLYSENDIEEDNDGFEEPEEGQMEVKAAKKMIDDVFMNESEINEAKYVDTSIGIKISKADMKKLHAGEELTIKKKGPSGPIKIQLKADKDAINEAKEN